MDEEGRRRETTDEDKDAISFLISKGEVSRKDEEKKEDYRV